MKKGGIMVHRVIVTFQKNSGGPSDFTFHVNDIETRDIELTSADQITWELDTAGSTPGTNWAPGEGIVFQSPWITAGNAQPTLDVSSNIYQVNDQGPFNTHGLTFEYTVKVQTAGDTIHSTDPDVTNTPPP